jgi:hypothetical protein
VKGGQAKCGQTDGRTAEAKTMSPKILGDIIIIQKPNEMEIIIHKPKEMEIIIHKPLKINGNYHS